ncbi:MAG: hypothetical protein JXB49_15295 [Bacteroidales bacterium]|nr:hypothetical protein [Bacteroidales bacterium]
MSTKTIRLIAFLALLVHGVGHFQGVAAGLGLKINNASPAQSWLFKNLSIQLNKSICLTLFLITGIIGVLTALGFKSLVLADSWQILAVITAILSTICLIVFPNGFAMFFNKIGAISVNLIIYYSVAFGQNWPAVLFED